MMTPNGSFLFFMLLMHLFVISPGATADVDPSTSVSPGTVCQTTPNPAFCRSVFSAENRTNTYGYGRSSVRKSLSQSQKFLNLIDNYLRKHGSSLSTSAVGALQDCRYLATLNMEFLLSSFATMAATNQTLSTVKAEDVQTYLSAALTNEQTCLEGIQSTATAWSVRDGLTVPLANDTKLFSVTLALFTKAWVPKKLKGKKWTPSTKQLAVNGRLPLKMTDRTRAIYETVSRRNLLQTVYNDVEVVDVSDMVTVSQDGSGNFTSINDAVSVAPNKTDGSNGYFLIYITAGVYEEYVSIPKNKYYLMMIGDGINKTVITGNRSVVDGWTTFNSATFAVTARNFVAVNITFRNTAGPEKHQAVALRSGSDFSTFYSCSFEAYQDTLYVHSLRQFYRDCDIYGTVDYIFGNAAAVFQNCNLYPRLPMSGQFNAITAQGRTDPNQNTGISIDGCTIKAADELAASNMTVQTYLGRPWKEYSRTVYMRSSMDSVVDPAGWREWNGDFALSTLYYAEYDNSGPGSDLTNRVTWPGYRVINSTDAANFTVAGFLLGDVWLPHTGVPFVAGLSS